MFYLNVLKLVRVILKISLYGKAHQENTKNVLPTLLSFLAFLNLFGPPPPPYTDIMNWATWALPEPSSIHPSSCHDLL